MSIEFRADHCENRDLRGHEYQQTVRHGRAKPLTVAAAIWLCLSMISSAGAAVIKEEDCNQWDWETKEAEEDLDHANSTLHYIQENYQNEEETILKSERSYCRSLNGLTTEIVKEAYNFFDLGTSKYPYTDVSIIIGRDIECAIWATKRLQTVRKMDPNLYEYEEVNKKFHPLIRLARQKRAAQAHFKKMQDRLAAKVAKRPPHCNGR